jgi:hypothetical protein
MGTLAREEARRAQPEGAARGLVNGTHFQVRGRSRRLSGKVPSWRQTNTGGSGGAPRAVVAATTARLGTDQLYRCSGHVPEMLVICLPGALLRSPPASDGSREPSRGQRDHGPRRPPTRARSQAAGAASDRAAPPRSGLDASQSISFASFGSARWVVASPRPKTRPPSCPTTLQNGDPAPCTLRLPFCARRDPYQHDRPRKDKPLCSQ